MTSSAATPATRSRDRGADPAGVARRERATPCRTTPSPSREGSAARSFSWLAVAGISRQASLFLVNWHLMTVLSRDCFGVVSLAFGTMIILTGVSDFGLRQVGWREIARSPQQMEPVTAAVLGARVVAALLALAAYGIIAWFACHDIQAAWIYGLFSVGVVVNLGTFDFPFLACQRMDIVVRLTLVGFVGYFAACQWTVLGDATAWLVPVYLAASFGGIVACLALRYGREFGPLWIDLRPANVIRYLARGWGLMLNGTLVRLGFNYPILVISAVLSAADVADYRAAEIFYLFGISFGEYLAASVFGRMARWLETDRVALRELLGRALQMILTCGLPLSFLGVYYLPALIEWFVPRVHSATASTAVMLSVLLPLGMLSRFLRAIMPGLGLDYPLLLANISSMVLGILGGWYAVATVGIPGMAAALLVAELWSIAWLCLAIRGRIGEFQLAAVTGRALVGTVLALAGHLVLTAQGTGDLPRAVIVLGLFFAVNGRVAFQEVSAALRAIGWVPSGGPALNRR